MLGVGIYDLLIVSRCATVGRMCTVDLHDMFCLLGSVILIKPIALIPSEYLKIVMKSPQIFTQLLSASGSTAQPAIYLKDIKNLIPYTPTRRTTPHSRQSRRTHDPVRTAKNQTCHCANPATTTCRNPGTTSPRLGVTLMDFNSLYRSHAPASLPLS